MSETEVREKLELALATSRKTYVDDSEIYVSIPTRLSRLQAQLSEALALMESEREYDPWKFGHHCDQEEGPEHNLVCQLPKGHECDHVHFGSAGLHDSPGDSFRWPRDPASEDE